MCGRFTLIEPPGRTLQALFHTLDAVEIVPRYNIAPTQPVVVVREESGRRIMQFARWGLVPRWVGDPRDFPLLVNARAETMAEKPAFRDALRHGRCILPASGYYEWHTGPGGRKQPWYMTLAEAGPMALAGLHAIWVGPDGEEVDTVATITVPANARLSAVHDRMPAILPGAEVDAWLDRRTGLAEARALIRPLPDDALVLRPVSARVNDARRDDPGLIAPQPVEEPEQPPPPRGQLDLF